MCCAFLSLLLLGPRIAGLLWWVLQPLRWEAAFRNILGGGLWWLWIGLGIAFLPWTTLMYVIVAPGGVNGFDWLWLGLMFLADLASYGGGVGRNRIPGYEGY